MSDNEQYILAKLALIDGLLRDLYVESFERRENPQQAAASRAEAYGRGSQTPSESDVPGSLALLHSELINQFFDDVGTELRRRAEIRARANRPDKK